MVASVSYLPGTPLVRKPLYSVQVITNGIVQPQVAGDQELPSRLGQW